MDGEETNLPAGAMFDIRMSFWESLDGVGLSNLKGLSSKKMSASPERPRAHGTSQKVLNPG
jgi:hypothetical protein